MLLPSSLVQSSCPREPFCWNGVVVLGLCVYCYLFSQLLFSVCVCVFLSVLSDLSQIVYTHCEGEKKKKKSLCRDFISSGGEVKSGVKQHTKINKNQQQSTPTTTTATSTTTPPTTNNNHHHHHHHHAGCCSSCGRVQGFLDCL